MQLVGSAFLQCASRVLSLAFPGFSCSPVMQLMTGEREIGLFGNVLHS